MQYLIFILDHKDSMDSQIQTTLPNYVGLFECYEKFPGTKQDISNRQFQSDETFGSTHQRKSIHAPETTMSCFKYQQKNIIYRKGDNIRNYKRSVMTKKYGSMPYFPVYYLNPEMYSFWFIVRFLCSAYVKNENARGSGSTLCQDNERIMSSDKNNECFKEYSNNYARYAACLGIKANAHTEKRNLLLEDLLREIMIKRKFLKRIIKNTEPERKSKLGLRMIRF